MSPSYRGRSRLLIRGFVATLLIVQVIALVSVLTSPATAATSQPYHDRIVQLSTTEVTATETPAPGPTSTPRPTATPTSTAAPGQPTLLFSDEFSGTSLDGSKWNTCHWWGNEGCTLETNGELVWYQPDDVLVSDGTLKLRAQKRAIKASDGKTYRYTSGMVTTGKDTWDLSEPPKFAFQYGYAETRVKVPKGQGLWPAFWLLPASKEVLPEIDIMEIIGRKFNTNYMVLHYRADDGTHRSSSRGWEGPDWSADWHTFALDWQPTALTWYVDGVPRFRYTNTAHIPAESMVVVLNLAVGGRWPGPPDSTTPFPSALEVDYVKVWSEMPPTAVVTTKLVEQPPATTEVPTPSPRATEPGFTPTPTAVPGQATLLFSDNFDGPTLDPNKWNTCFWWGDGHGGCTIITANELEWYQPDNVLVSEGTLKLRVQKQTIHTGDNKTYDYTSGMVSTGRSTQDDPLPDKFAFQYGYAEIRAKIPAGQGLWPSFWLLPANQGWPPELDVMTISGAQTNETIMGVYYFNTDGSQGRNMRPWRDPDLSAGWHTFAVEWQPSGIFWYVDGVKRWGDTNPVHSPATPMYLIVSLAVRGDYPGPPDSTTPLPSYFEIDYAKVWSERPR